MPDKIFEALLKKELGRIFDKFTDIVNHNIGQSVVFRHHNDDDILTSMQKAGYTINPFHKIHTNSERRVGDISRKIITEVNEIRADIFKDFFNEDLKSEKRVQSL